jgi:predicted DNA-binding transcriptional regulator AlpA
MPEKLELVGISEIAALLGVTRQRVDKLSRTDEDFPEPVAELHAGRIWMRASVLRWARASGRTLVAGTTD